MLREKLDFAGGVLSGFPWPCAKGCGLIARRRMYKNGDHREFRARRSSSGVLEGLTIFYSRRPQMALQLADANRRGDVPCSADPEYPGRHQSAQNRETRLLLFQTLAAPYANLRHAAPFTIFPSP